MNSFPSLGCTPPISIGKRNTKELHFWMKSTYLFRKVKKQIIIRYLKLFNLTIPLTYFHIFIH